MSQCRAPPNIALIKYWGKSDDLINAPHNDSLSLTLDTNVLCSTCMVQPSSTDEDLFYLNDQPSPISSRLSRQLLHIRQKTGNSQSLLIKSSNNFPTAAGLASSASGYAAMAGALTHFLCPSLDPDHCSILARLGSGSASRSIHGGLVRWSSSHPFSALQVLPAEQLESLRVLVLVFSGEEKEIGSSQGMKITAETCASFKTRKERAHNRLEKMIDSFKSQNWASVFELTMNDSDDLHQMCRDSTPSINYLSSSSIKLINSVQRINSLFNTICGYTFDAGPNGFVIFHKENINVVVDEISKDFPDLNSYYHLINDYEAKSSVTETEHTEIINVYYSSIGDGLTCNHYQTK
ncbi:hypothetical protein P9112_004711 [Eukaryota sp. TZLM1-RC]